MDRDEFSPEELRFMAHHEIDRWYAYPTAMASARASSAAAMWTAWKSGMGSGESPCADPLSTCFCRAMLKF